MEEYVHSEKEISKLSGFEIGLKAGMPIAIGYVPIAVTFGLVSKSLGISSLVSIAMSMFIFAGASQFIGINLMAAGASTLEIVITTFILNFRHFLMSSSLSQRIENNVSKKFLSMISFGITDETFAVASMISGQVIEAWFLFGLNLIAYTSWVFGTVIGIFLGSTVPENLKSSMGIALYAMFIGLLIPSLKGSRSTVLVVLIAVLVNSIIKWVPIFSFISLGWSVIISTIVAALMGALLCPVHIKE